MDFCLRVGLRHDEFLGWPDIERAKILAKMVHDAAVHVCGTRTADWYDDDGRLAIPAPMELDLRECEGCLILAEARENMTESDRKRFHFGWSRPDLNGEG